MVIWIRDIYCESENHNVLIFHITYLLTDVAVHQEHPKILNTFRLNKKIFINTSYPKLLPFVMNLPVCRVQKYTGINFQYHHHSKMTTISHISVLFLIALAALTHGLTMKLPCEYTHKAYCCSERMSIDCPEYCADVTCRNQPRLLIKLL